MAGDNRYLSGDLLDFMARLLPSTLPQDRRQRTFYVSTMTDDLPEGSFYAPGTAYDHGDSCILLRNPHIARNEELQLSLFDPKEVRKQMLRHYLSHLTDVVMVDFSGLAVEPLIRDAHDWEARFETVRSTFSSRVGQVCNAALDRSIIAYNEHSDAQERQRCQEETELLAILTGLEIDSAKSGVRPDLDEYLKHRKVQRTPFLQHKNLIEQAETRRAWYEPTHRQRLKVFFEKTDWAHVDANVERLPYLARQLERHTPAAKGESPPRTASCLPLPSGPPGRSSWTGTPWSGSTACSGTIPPLSRIRACRAPIRAKRRKNDIERILFARGQEDAWDTDELYAQLEALPPERVAESKVRQFQTPPFAPSTDGA